MDVIDELYADGSYPAMSHPLSDPAVSAVAARMYGLRAVLPSDARILEIGCCSGHNLIPLAMRWPETIFTGIDLSPQSIGEARQRAEAAGAANIQFVAADLRDFVPENGPFDFIIAHGFFSWVPDEVKMALLQFCARHLTDNGIATISFNLSCGWERRLPVIEKVRAIQGAAEVDVMTALGVLSGLEDLAVAEREVIADMIAKGPAILAFDDFGPVNDPWPLDAFVRAAANAGLRWLGESDPSQNFPRDLPPETLATLQARATDPLALQMAADAAVARTFRSGVLCKTTAPAEPLIDSRVAFEFSVRCGDKPSDRTDRAVWNEINSHAPSCVPLEKIALAFPDHKSLALAVIEGIQQGWLKPRIEPVWISKTPPFFPSLDPFRKLCANQGLPLPDAWHVPCTFSKPQYELLRLMNGTRDLTELRGHSRDHFPTLDFDAWLTHIAGRGLLQ